MSQNARHTPAPPPFQTALLLTDDEANASTDRAVLRRTGIRRPRIQTSGVDVALYLADSVRSVLYPVNEVILCLPRLTDMDAPSFASLIRTHPLLGYVPLLAITTGGESHERLLAAGFNAVIQRPFTAGQLAALLETLADNARAARAELIATLRQSGVMPSRQPFVDLLGRYAALTPPRQTQAKETGTRQPSRVLAVRAAENREDKPKESVPVLTREAEDKVRPASRQGAEATDVKRSGKGIRLAEEPGLSLQPLPSDDSQPGEGKALGDFKPSRLPAALGDALTVIRGTVRLYRASRGN